MTESPHQTHGMPPVRIGPAAFTKHVGGVRRSALEFAAALRDIGVSVEVPHNLDTAVTMSTESQSLLAQLGMQMAEAAFPVSPANIRRSGIRHSLYYDNLLGCKRWPIVVTVYDMIHEIFGVGSPILRRLKRKAIRKASHIVTISDTTRADLYRYLDIDCPVSVIPLGISESFLSKDPEARRDVAPYLLHIGSRQGYKNFELLFDAWSSSSSLRNFRLVAVGGGGLSASESRTFAQAIRERRFEHRPWVDESDLSRLYCDAAALIVPSRYEGFGLPVLEAMAVGTPVACSTGGSLVEVANGHAAHFSPDSPVECARAIENAIAMATGAKSLASAYAREFSWDRCARDHVELYRSLSGN